MWRNLFLQQQIRFAVENKATPNHVTKSIFDDHCTTHYGTLRINTKLIVTKVGQFFKDVDNTDVKAPILANTHRGWIVDASQTDTTLSREVSK